MWPYSVSGCLRTVSSSLEVGFGVLLDNVSVVVVVFLSSTYSSVILLKAISLTSNQDNKWIKPTSGPAWQRITFSLIKIAWNYHFQWRCRWSNSSIVCFKYVLLWLNELSHVTLSLSIYKITFKLKKNLKIKDYWYWKMPKSKKKKHKGTRMVKDGED